MAIIASKAFNSPSSFIDNTFKAKMKTNSLVLAWKNAEGNNHFAVEKSFLTKRIELLKYLINIFILDNLRLIPNSLKKIIDIRKFKNDIIKIKFFISNSIKNTDVKDNRIKELLQSDPNNKYLYEYKIYKDFLKNIYIQFEIINIIVKESELEII